MMVLKLNQHKPQSQFEAMCYKTGNKHDIEDVRGHKCNTDHYIVNKSINTLAKQALFALKK